MSSNPFFLSKKHVCFSVWIVLFYSALCLAQKDSLKVEVNGLFKPHLASTHHFGLFSSRMTQSFKVRASAMPQLHLETQSGNNFHAPVQAFLPDDPGLRTQFADQIWYFRVFDFVDQETTPAQVMDIEIDAVYKVYRPALSFPLNDRNEIRIGLRAFQTVKGNFFDSPFTNDASIEWFHSNIAGGEDPFGRKFYGVNEVAVNYTDRKGKTLNMQAGDIILGGIELAHTYYPELQKWNERNLFFNLQSQIGWNTSAYNNSLDLGIGINAVKKYFLNNKSDLWLGLGYSVLCKNAIDGRDNLDLGNNRFLGSGEVMAQWTHQTSKGNQNIIGVNYQNQTSYFKKEEADYFHLKGDYAAINQGWHYGYTTLIENLSSWSLLYTHARPKISYTIYVKEDLNINNAPDVETGISVQIPL
ncbi:MAG: hypothetical protein ACJAWA_001389 [Nonlabens sp.]|jgi:hypothetical protein